MKRETENKLPRKINVERRINKKIIIKEKELKNFKKLVRKVKEAK